MEEMIDSQVEDETETKITESEDFLELKDVVKASTLDALRELVDNHTCS